MHIFAPHYIYLDPGSGSLIAQLLAGGLVGIGILVKVFWNQIKSLFTKKNKPEA